MVGSSHKQGHHDGRATEHTPLLSGSHQAQDDGIEAVGLVAESAGSQGDERRQQRDSSTTPAAKPLPKRQILLLCYARLMEPIAFFSIFPFIAEMIHRNGQLPDSDVGFYSGLIESLFSATQMAVFIPLGRLSDRYGRKPVLLYSLCGMSIGPILFCMSRTIWQMILFRCLAGVFSGSSLIIRTMISEHSTPETQARAFSWFAFGGNLGIFVGPIIGGALADPAIQYPSVFGGVPFFEQYPYALPGFVTGCISATGAVASALFLEETLPEKRFCSDGTSATKQAQEGVSMWELITAPGVGVVLWVYNHVMLLAFAFTAIIPVALYTPVKIGGLGFGPSLISLYMAVQGASQSLWLLLVFPLIQKRIGTKGVMKACGYAYPFFFAGYILLNYLLRDGSHAAVVSFWIVGPIVALIGPGVSMAFTGAQLALNDVSPDPHVLGTLNAIALTATSGIRAIVPGVSTALFAVGVRNQIFGGHLAWVILIPLAIAYAICARYLPSGRQPERATANDQET